MTKPSELLRILKTKEIKSCMKNVMRILLLRMKTNQTILTIIMKWYLMKIANIKSKF